MYPRIILHYAMQQPNGPNWVTNIPSPNDRTVIHHLFIIITTHMPAKLRFPPLLSLSLSLHPKS